MSVCFSGSLPAYSAVIILVCFMLCWRIKYDDVVLRMTVYGCIAYFTVDACLSY